jgi:hypothetical protein
MRYHFIIGLALCGVLGGCASIKEGSGSPTVSLDQTVYFMTPDQGDAIATPGLYRVDVSEPSRLRLDPGEGKNALVIQAQEINHKEELSAPVALSILGGENVHHLALLLPGGKGLDAVGSYSLVRPRGSPPQLIQLQVQGPKKVVLLNQFNSSVPEIPAQVAWNTFATALVRSGAFIVGAQNPMAAEYALEGMVTEARAVPGKNVMNELLKGLLAPGAEQVGVRVDIKVIDPRTGYIVDSINVSSGEQTSNKLTLYDVGAFVQGLTSANRPGDTAPIGRTRKDLIDFAFAGSIIEAVNRIVIRAGQYQSAPSGLAQAGYPQSQQSIPGQYPADYGYPSSGYPPQAPQLGGAPGYPSSQSPGYPSSGYPPSPYPQQAPPTGGAPAYPSTQLPPSTYPSSGYPPSQYPSQGYGYPAPGYPPPQTPPPGGYPQTQPGSPGSQQGSPPPPGGYPQTQPSPPGSQQGYPQR